MSGLIGLLAGFLVWSSSFAALYGLHATGCAAGWQDPGHYASPLRLALGLVWLLHVAALAWLAVRFARPAQLAPAQPAEAPTAAFLERAAFTLTLVAVAATLATGAPIVILELCR